MTVCYITIDTEYESKFTKKMGISSRKENFLRSILCETSSGHVGIEYQMDVLDKYGLKAVFFVDPMPALLWGVSCVEDIVGPITSRGHDVQLHIHTEWLEMAGTKNPLNSRTGLNIKDFTFEEQCILLDYAKSVLISAGAPSLVAFRAGNYGANDDTLRALAQIGLRYDTSYCPGITDSSCDIALTSFDVGPIEHCGVIEVPIGCIAGRGDRLRHMQITALSNSEVIAALRHAQQNDAPYVTVVSHSFELLNRKRTKINRVVKHRFELISKGVGGLAGISTGTYASIPPQVSVNRRTTPILPFNPLRTGLRMAEQALANALYGAK